MVATARTHRNTGSGTAWFGGAYWGTHDVESRETLWGRSVEV
jgi:hypothetical protein